MRNAPSYSPRPTLKNLALEVDLLRSAVIGLAGRDDEGIYRPEFVEEMLSAVRTDAPTKEFISARNFLRQLRDAS